MEEIYKKIEKIEEDINSRGEFLKIEEKKESIRKLQMKMSAPDFWQDQKESSRIVGELKSLKGDVNNWDDLSQKLKDLKELLTIADVSMEGEIVKETEGLLKEVEQLKLRTLFSGKFDDANAIVEINAGAGGTEACDWASMLFRMYFRWAEEKKFKIRVFNELKGEEAGLKNITFFTEGLRAYGLLKAERGVHRLVRISPFDSNKRRHTSFASVDILPEIKEDVDIEIKPEDLRIDTFRASGAGGQHVNKTDSAVRITHLPTAIVVGSQSERSQHQNKYAAMQVLKAKLYKLKEEEKRKEMENLTGIKQRIEWGSQIRSYVLHPYLLVKDHRTDVEIHDAWAVLDGRLDDFIYAYLKYCAFEERKV